MTKMLLPARILLLYAVWLAVHAQSTTQLGKDGQSVVVHNQQQIHDKIREMNSKMEGMDSKMEGMDSKMEGMDSKMEEIESKIEGIEDSVADVSTKQGSIETKIDKLQQDLSTLECSSAGGGNEEVAKSIEDLMNDHVNIKTQLSDLRSKMQTLSNSVPASGSCNSTGGQTVPCKVEGECDRGWKQYGVNCFFLWPVVLLRQNALNFCRLENSDLASFDDNAELQAVIKMYNIGDRDKYWVKGVKVSGRWMWDNCVTEGLSTRCTYEPLSDDLSVYISSHTHDYVSITIKRLYSTNNAGLHVLCKYTLQ